MTTQIIITAVPVERMIEKAKPQTKTLPARKAVYRWFDTYRYRFTRPCGHLHVCDSVWFTREDAQRHAEWALINTLCTKILSTEVLPASNPRWLGDGRYPVTLHKRCCDRTENND